MWPLWPCVKAKINLVYWCRLDKICSADPCWSAAMMMMMKDGEDKESVCKYGWWL